MILKSLVFGTILTILVAFSANAGDNVISNTVPAAASATSIRKLGPSDKIQVVVYQEDDLGATVTLDEKGMVMLPLLGKINLGGMTVEAATECLQTNYGRDYLVNPQINITVLEYAPRHFSVLGEVQRPGSFDIPDNQDVNILEAIALAGGYTRLGSPEKVTVRRTLPNGDTKNYPLNADALAKESSGKLFQILPNDIVTVGERVF